MSDKVFKNQTTLTLFCRKSWISFSARDQGGYTRRMARAENRKETKTAATMTKIAQLSAFALLAVSFFLTSTVQAWPASPISNQRRQASTRRRQQQYQPSRRFLFSKTPRPEILTKELHASKETTDDTSKTPKFKFGPKERQDFITASKSGLAVSLAMVPEAGRR